jgi:hypothetical protein
MGRRSRLREISPAMKSRMLDRSAGTSQQWPLVKLHLEKITAAVEACTPGSYADVDIPFPAK